MKIAIMGAGAFGTALGKILTANSYDTEYYDPKVQKNDLDQCLDGADYVLLCVPSDAVPSLIPHLPLEVPLIVATKGFLNDKVFDCFSDYMIISGPGFADDIKVGIDTFLTITDNRLAKLFAADFMHFDVTNDKNGVLMCGALKNIYAIGAGMRGLEKNSVDWQNYIKNATNEMKKILELNFCNPETVNLFCGKPDLTLTCGYPSRNYEFGDKLRQDSNYRPGKTVEGVAALKRILDGEIKIPTDAHIIHNLLEKCNDWV